MVNHHLLKLISSFLHKKKIDEASHNTTTTFFWQKKKIQYYHGEYLLCDSMPSYPAYSNKINKLTGDLSSMIEGERNFTTKKFTRKLNKLKTEINKHGGTEYLKDHPHLAKKLKEFEHFQKTLSSHHTEYVQEYLDQNLKTVADSYQLQDDVIGAIATWQGAQARSTSHVKIKTRRDGSIRKVKVVKKWRASTDNGIAVVWDTETGKNIIKPPKNPKETMTEQEKKDTRKCCKSLFGQLWYYDWVNDMRKDDLISSWWAKALKAIPKALQYAGAAVTWILAIKSLFWWISWMISWDKKEMSDAINDFGAAAWRWATFFGITSVNRWKLRCKWSDRFNDDDETFTQTNENKESNEAVAYPARTLRLLWGIPFSELHKFLVFDGDTVTDINDKAVTAYINHPDNNLWASRKEDMLKVIQQIKEDRANGNDVIKTGFAKVGLTKTELTDPSKGDENFFMYYNEYIDKTQKEADDKEQKEKPTDESRDKKDINNHTAQLASYTGLDQHKKNDLIKYGNTITKTLALPTRLAFNHVWSKLYLNSYDSHNKTRIDPHSLTIGNEHASQPFSFQAWSIKELLYMANMVNQMMLLEGKSSHSEAPREVSRWVSMGKYDLGYDIEFRKGNMPDILYGTAFGDRNISELIDASFDYDFLQKHMPRIANKDGLSMFVRYLNSFKRQSALGWLTNENLWLHNENAEKEAKHNDVTDITQRVWWWDIKLEAKEKGKLYRIYRSYTDSTGETEEYDINVDVEDKQLFGRFWIPLPFASLQDTIIIADALNQVSMIADNLTEFWLQKVGDTITSIWWAIPEIAKKLWLDTVREELKAWAITTYTFVKKIVSTLLQIWWVALDVIDKICNIMMSIAWLTEYIFTGEAWKDLIDWTWKKRHSGTERLGEAWDTLDKHAIRWENHRKIIEEAKRQEVRHQKYDTLDTTQQARVDSLLQEIDTKQVFIINTLQNAVDAKRMLSEREQREVIRAQRRIEKNKDEIDEIMDLSLREKRQML